MAAYLGYCENRKASLPNTTRSGHTEDSEKKHYNLVFTIVLFSHSLRKTASLKSQVIYLVISGKRRRKKMFECKILCYGLTKWFSQRFSFICSAYAQLINILKSMSQLVNVNRLLSALTEVFKTLKVRPGYHCLVLKLWSDAIKPTYCLDCCS